MIHLHFLVLFVFYIGKIAFVQSECQVPSQFWCDNHQISTECGVLAQCNSLKRSTYDRPVEFGLYYESLCPGCRSLIQTQLTSAFQKVGSIMTLNLVPYGNAQERYDQRTGQWTYSCQHGQQECVGNVIETCAMNMYNTTSAYFPFISCMEASSQDPKQAAIQCASLHKLDIQSILACSTSARGNALEHQMALKTNALQPPHQYVPWVTLNGVHTDQIQSKAELDLVRLICDSYTGASKPPACSS